jgi:hypothetical protein
MKCLICEEETGSNKKQYCGEYSDKNSCASIRRNKMIKIAKDKSKESCNVKTKPKVLKKMEISAKKHKRNEHLRSLGYDVGSDDSWLNA